MGAETFGRLRYALLGDVRAWRGEVELDLGPARQRSVLAVLLLNRRRDLTVAQIIGAVWGDQPPRTAPAAVHTYLSRLRPVLAGGGDGPSDVLVRHRSGYALADGATVDAEAFAALLADARRSRQAGRLRLAAGHYATALQLWSGTPFATLTGPAIDAARVRLVEEHLCAVEERAEIELDLGHHDREIPRLRELVFDHPLRERLWASLLVALYRADRRGEAIAAYAQLREVFGDSLGIEPGPRLRRLHNQLLVEDPALSQRRESMAHLLRIRVADGPVEV